MKGFIASSVFIAGALVLATSWSFAADAPPKPQVGGADVKVNPPRTTGGVQVDVNPPGAGRDAPRTEVDIRNPRTGQPIYQGSFDGSWRNRLRDERGDYRWQNFRGADVGLWFNRNSKDSLVIADVGTTGAIAKLGFREGDRIVSVNDQRVVREGDFSRFLFAPENRAGRVNVVILRDGKEQTIFVEPQLLMDEFTNHQSDPLDRVGLMIDDRTSDRILVTRVAPYSPAYYAGIRAGDVITSFRGQAVTDPATFVRSFDRLEPGNVAVVVHRNNGARQLERNLELEIEGDRQTLLKPEVNGATPTERREEIRDERRDERRERIDNRQPTPTTPGISPAPGKTPVPAPQP